VALGVIQPMLATKKKKPATNQGSEIKPQHASTASVRPAIGGTHRAFRRIVLAPKSFNARALS